MPQRGHRRHADGERWKPSISVRLTSPQWDIQRPQFSSGRRRLSGGAAAGDQISWHGGSGLRQLDGSNGTFSGVIDGVIPDHRENQTSVAEWFKSSGIGLSGQHQSVDLIE